MGIWSRLTGGGNDLPEPTPDNNREPSIDRPTHTVRYTDENGKSVELQTYSAVSAEMIKEQHPDAVINPTKHQ